ncbi:MAG: hypothetical protein PUP92_24730 [Rhizonema sp. PD38]|nr:hypothetical protein [Rhizonema sp. PD38]
MKKRVGRPGAFTSEQEDFLLKFLVQYKAAQKRSDTSANSTKKELTKFWPGFWEEWFALWPVLDSDGLEDNQSSVKKVSLYNWDQ